MLFLCKKAIKDDSFAVAARYGNLLELRDFVEEAHKEGIGVIMDWVPGHFCKNDYALSYFDGTPTFEYADPNRAINNRWGTLNFDLGKAQVHSFLISNAVSGCKSSILMESVSMPFRICFILTMMKVHGHRMRMAAITIAKESNSSRR